MSLFAKSVTVSRKGSKTFNAGVNDWVGPDDSTFTILASVQPLRVQEAAAAADLTQGKEAYWMFQEVTPTAVRLRCVQDDGTADHVTMNGKMYEVVTVSDWLNGVRSHYKNLVRCLVPVGSP